VLDRDVRLLPVIGFKKMPKFLPPVLPPCLDGVGKNKQRGKDWPLLGHTPIFGKILLVFSSVRHFSPVARHGHTIKIAAGGAR